MQISVITVTFACYSSSPRHVPDFFPRRRDTDRPDVSGSRQALHCSTFPLLIHVGRGWWSHHCHRLRRGEVGCLCACRNPISLRAVRDGLRFHQNREDKIRYFLCLSRSGERWSFCNRLPLGRHHLDQIPRVLYIQQEFLRKGAWEDPTLKYLPNIFSRSIWNPHPSSLCSFA